MLLRQLAQGAFFYEEQEGMAGILLYNPNSPVKRDFEVIDLTNWGFRYIPGDLEVIRLKYIRTALRNFKGGRKFGDLDPGTTFTCNMDSVSPVVKISGIEHSSAFSFAGRKVIRVDSSRHVYPVQYSELILKR